MSDTNTGLNLNSLPDDIREALSQTFGDDFTNASTLNQLFSETDSSVIQNTDINNNTVSTINDEEQDEFDTSSFMNLEEVVSPKEKIVEAKSLTAEVEENIDIDTLFTNSVDEEQKINVDKIIEQSISVSENHLTKKIEAKLVEESALRYSDAPWYKSLTKIGHPITIVGAGGIGSWTTLLLSKFNININLFDGDTFEEVNMAGQIFPISSLGICKSTAIRELCRHINGTTTISTYNHWNPVLHRTSPITIVAVDNMEIRMAVFRRWQNEFGNLPNALFIDSRLAAELFQIYSIKGGDTLAQKRYVTEWFSDAEADETPCSYKQTAYMAAMLSARIVNNFVNFLALQSGKEMIPRIVPFYIEYEAYGYEKIINYA